MLPLEMYVQNASLKVTQCNFYNQELTNNALDVWDTKSNWNPIRVAQDNETMIWIDTFAIDERGWLWFTSRGWPIDSQPKIVRIFIGAKPYLHK